MVKKKGNVQEIGTESQPIIVEGTTGKSDLLSKLAELKEQSGMVGYIVREASNAVVDLRDSERISNYALFSSATSETVSELSSIFALGRVRQALVETEQMNLLSVDIGESKICVFLEKNADIEGVYRKLLGA